MAHEPVRHRTPLHAGPRNEAEFLGTAHKEENAAKLLARPIRKYRLCIPISLRTLWVLRLADHLAPLSLALLSSSFTSSSVSPAPCFPAK